MAHLLHVVLTTLELHDAHFLTTTVADHLCCHLGAIDHRRKRRPVTCSLTPATDGGRAPEEALPGSGPGPDDVLRFVELRERIELALRDLPPEYRELILLRHRMACRYDEIARITDLPLGTVKNRIFRARELLRSRLGDALDAEARP